MLKRAPFFFTKYCGPASSFLLNSRRSSLDACLRCRRCSLVPSTIQEWRGLVVSSLLSSRCSITFPVTSANFEQDVLQSQQAICLVYYIENANCKSFIENVEKLTKELNEATEVNSKGESTTTQTEGTAKGSKSHVWLKLCTVNADENRNLASTFSVERAKLPITYFIMQGTIIDKVTGHIKTSRMHSILYKFMEHYQKEMNVDLLIPKANRNGSADGLTNPLATASTTDLLSGASAQFIINTLISSLRGADMIRLPEESNKLDGLRKTLQDAKRKAYQELTHLQREIGMDVRNLSDSELQSKYYRSAPFAAAASVSALEALFLARCYASIGDIARKNVVWARKAIFDDFEPVLGKPEIRQLIALIDVNTVKGDLKVSAAIVNKITAWCSTTSSNDSTLAMYLQGVLEFCGVLSEQVDNHIDSRAFEKEFPTSFVEQLFGWLIEGRKKMGKRGDAGSKGPQELIDLALSTTESPLTPEKEQTIRETFAACQFWQAKTVLTSLIQIYPSDAKGHAARSRLASLVY